MKNIPSGSDLPLLLHCCCAVCAAGCLKRLFSEEPGRAIYLFFSNSNLNSSAEFERRLAALETLAEHYDLPLITDEYDHDSWLEVAGPYAHCPERGERCKHCFRFSLNRTAIFAEQHNFAAFATTLTVSPHKSSKLIAEIGSSWPAFDFHDFKKRNGFLFSLQISETLNLYRQNYCGCEFSLISRQNQMAVDPAK